MTFNNVTGCNEVYLDTLRAICGNTENKSMIDLCCNLAPHTTKLGFRWTTFIDILQRELDNKEYQDYFRKENVLSVLENEDIHYDVSICSDGLEHFTEFDGILLLKLMQLRSDRMILFTPLGDYMVDTISTDPEGHHSGWTPAKFRYLPKDNFAFIVFPKYHPTLNIGAFFMWRCDNLKEDFERVKKELNTKSWTK